jgi:hypothetical protein
MIKNSIEFHLWDYDGVLETKERDEWQKQTEKGTFVGYKHYQTDKNGYFYLKDNPIGSIYCILGDSMQTINVIPEDKLIKTIFKNKKIECVCEFTT